MIIDNKKFIFFDIKDNHNKMWFIELHDNGNVVTTWGRVGSVMSSTTKTFDSEQSGQKEFNKLIKSKIKKGYVELKVENSIIIENNNAVIKQDIDFDLEQIALRDIDYDNRDQKLIDLIKLFCKENIHNITSNSNITYDTKTGLFSTPGGIVTKEAIIEARRILNEIQISFNANELYSENGLILVDQYCNIIPTKVRGKIEVLKIFPTNESIETQRSVLDSLDDSLNTVEQLKQKQLNDKNEITIKQPKIFNTTFKRVEDQTIINDIFNKFNNTHSNIHSCRNLKIRKIYEVNIDCMAKKYNQTKDSWVKQNKNINECFLWHGTRKSNIISIFKSGLIIPPSNASYCVGRMFGNYLYFSDQSTKSLNYSYGYWSNSSSGRDSHCFMFLCDVLMGNQYIPSCSCNKIPNGFDSIFAKAGQSGVMNNEMMVPVNQSNIKYLVEFSE